MYKIEYRLIIIDNLLNKIYEKFEQLDQIAEYISKISGLEVNETLMFKILHLEINSQSNHYPNSVVAKLYQKYKSIAIIKIASAQYDVSSSEEKLIHVFNNQNELLFTALNILDVCNKLNISRAVAYKIMADSKAGIPHKSGIILAYVFPELTQAEKRAEKREKKRLEKEQNRINEEYEKEYRKKIREIKAEK
jgi:hypothetical protein